MVIGTCNLAPLSLPTTVIVAYNAVLAPNNVLTVVALRLIVVPITVADTLVPNVVVELTFKASVESVSIPTPSNVDNNLTSEMVAV